MNKNILKTINSDKTLFDICKNLKKLVDSGKSNQELNNIIQELELPLNYHLYITANFSDLMNIVYK